MKLIIDSNTYNILAEADAYTFLDKKGSGNSEKPVAGSQVSAIGNVNGEYGENSPTGDEIGDMLTPQSYLRMHSMLANKYNMYSKINEESENNIDDNLKNRLNQVIKMINFKHRDSKSKAEVINYIITNLDINNLSGEDKNNIRDNIMR